MAFLTCNFYSEALGVGVTVNVVLPQATQTQIGVDAAVTPGDVPVLYLLHGLSDDHSAWMRYTSIERYAAEAGLAVVMPAVGRSFYANERVARVGRDDPRRHHVAAPPIGSVSPRYCR